MMFLVGMMGLMAVGATAFYGFGNNSPDDGVDLAPEQDADSTGQQPETLDGLTLLLGAGEAAGADAPGGAPAPGPAPDPAPGEIDWGDAADDSLIGSVGWDQINGYGGDDTIAGGEGGDRLHGEEGDDSLRGDDGDDTLHGGAGLDALHGGTGDDELFGHDGNDTLFGEAGDDSLVGSDGDDDLVGGEGNDVLHGDIGDDRLQGGTGADTLFGGWGNDVIIGLSGEGMEARTDYLNGGGGDDLILAGARDIVTAGEGADSIALGDWLSAAGHQAQILDYDSAEDSLMVVYDDLSDQEPEVTLEPDEMDPETTHIVLNGVRITAVANAADLTLDQIALIGQTTLDSLTAA